MDIIQDNSLVTLHYSINIMDNDNIIELANTFNQGTPASLTIGQGTLPSAIEQYLLNQTENSHIEAEINNAFGVYKQELQQLISPELIKAHSCEQEFESGDAVAFNTPQGQVAGIFMRLSENGGAWFDFNHPLAGKKIKFIAKIIGVIN